MKRPIAGIDRGLDKRKRIDAATAYGSPEPPPGTDGHAEPAPAARRAGRGAPAGHREARRSASHEAARIRGRSGRRIDGRAARGGARTPRRHVMGLLDKLKNRTRQLKGRGKEEAGRAADDPRLEGEGKADRAAGGVKQAGERAKDAARDIKRSFE